MIEKIINILPHKFHLIHKTLLLAIMLAFGAMVYSNTFDSPLVFDDEIFIINDTAVHMTELSPDAIKTAAVEGKPRHRFLPNISFALNYYFGQLNPIGYHLVNLIIHLLSGIFLFFFLRLTLHAFINKPIISTLCNRRDGVYPRPKRESIKPSPTMGAMITKAFDYKTNPDIIAFFAALLWIVQPVGTQSVTYICQRMASMVALFYILSLLFYVQGRMAVRQSPSNWRKPGLYFFGCLLSSVCAFATKENAGTLPLIILLYEWFFFQDLKLKWSRRQLLWITFFVIVFAGVVLWYMGENPMFRIMNSYRRRDFTLIERVMTEWRIVVYYLSLFLWAPPGRLNLDHDYPLSLSPVHPATTMVALAAILGLLAWAAYAAKKDRLIAFAILWFFITQATESTVIGIELIFEHRTYIPFMMICLLFVLAVFRFFKNRSLTYGLLVATALVFSVWTYQRNLIWQDPVTFWTDTFFKSADKPRAYKNLAYAYQQKKEWVTAVLYYKKALEIDETKNRKDFATYANLGAALVKQNSFFDAVYYYSKAIEQKKATADILQPFAFALTKIGKLEAAKMYYQMALNIFPEDESIKNKLAALTIFLNQHIDPDDQIRHLLAENPDDPALLLEQGDLFARQGEMEIDKAIAVYQTALGLTDNNQEFLNRAILSRLAMAYAVSRRFEDAIETYQRLIKITPDNAMLYYNTAAVYAIQGKISKAKTFLKKAADKGLNVEEKIKTDPNFEKMREVEGGR